jgi:hypothetical protein
MGMSPAQIDELSIWQFLAAANGYAKANGGEDDKLSGGEVDDLWDWLQSKG